MTVSFAKLEEIAEVNWGNTSITKASYTTNGFPAFSATGCDGFLPTFDRDCDGVILSAIGAKCGKCFSASGKWTAIKNTITITPHTSGQADFRYLYYYLNREELWPRRGVGQPFIGLGDARELLVPFPSLAEQRRIAAILDKADELRTKRRAALAKLETLTQAIFLDLFGDPVANPKRWPDPRLGGLLTTQKYGPRFYNESYSVEGIRIVRITDLDETGTLDFSKMPRLAVSDAEREKYALHPGDLIFARSGATVGKVALIQPDYPPCIAGAYFITMRFAESLEPIYARSVLTAPSIRAIVVKQSRQAAQQNFSGPGLRQLPMPLPPLGLQREFVRRVAAVEKLKAAHHASLTQLDALFGSLQHRAFRGEL